MRRLGTTDRLLLATLLPLWGVFLWISVGEGLRNGQLRVPLVPRSAESPSSYPSVWEPSWADDPTDTDLRAGDEILRAGSADLRGRSAGSVIMRLIEAARETGAATVEVARAGRRWTMQLETRPKSDWWAPVPFSFASVLAVVLILLRRPDWFLARRAFVGGVSAGVGFLHYFGLRNASGYAEAFALVIAVPCALGLVLDGALAMPVPRRRPAWQRALPWLLAVLYGGQFAAVIWWAPPLSLRGYLTVRAAFLMAWFVAFVSAAVASYRRADAKQRRQLRWVGFGFYMGAVPIVAAFFLHAIGIPPYWQRVAYTIGAVALSAAPLGMLVAIVWLDWLDVDRLISATAAYTLSGVALVALLLGATPTLAGLTSRALAIPGPSAQLGVALVLAILLVPLRRGLQPRVDRLFFADHLALEQGVARLLEELVRPTSVAELAGLLGDRLAALLRPDSLAIYAREQSGFAPILVRGGPAPPAFPLQSPLIAALEARGTPLAAARWSERRDAPRDPFEHAALETLGAAAVLPLRRGTTLAAFVSLGPKRNGDVYTASDFALLAAVASRVSERLASIDQADLLRDAHALQASLRRYVPGALLDRVARGEEPPAGEREVTVLFVDIRNYTQLVEGLAAGEIFSAITRHTERVSALVAKHGGAVVEFHGDGLLAVFGAPDPLPRKERAAVAAAREIVTAVQAVSRETGGPSLTVGVGVATGAAYVGNVCGHDREIWSVIGNPTNLAARLQVLTRELGAVIAIDVPTRLAADYVCSDFASRPGVPIRGRSAPVDVWFLPEQPAPT